VIGVTEFAIYYFGRVPPSGMSAVTPIADKGDSTEQGILASEQGILNEKTGNLNRV
jgi:hypothetical protein